MERPRRLLLDGETDVAAQIEALAVHLISPALESLADTAYGLATYDFGRRHIREVPDSVAEVEQDSGDSRGHAESSLNVCACAWTRTGKPQMSMKPTADVRSKASPLSYVASARS